MTLASRITERAQAYVRKPSLAPLESNARGNAELVRGIIARSGYGGYELSLAMVPLRAVAQRELSTPATPED